MLSFSLDMVNLFLFTFVFSLLAGQLIKIPLYLLNGLIALDLFVILMNIILLTKIKLKASKIPKILNASVPFLVIALLSLFFTPLHLSFQEYLISFSYLARLFIYLLLATLLSLNQFNLFKSKIPQTLSVAGILLAIAGFLQLLFFPSLKSLGVYGWDPHFYRVVSTWLDPNFLGAFLVLTLILLVKKPFLFLIVFLALLATFSRSSVLMFTTSFIILSLLNRSLKFLLISLTLAVTLYSGILLYDQIISYPNEINRNQSAQYRIKSWEMGLEIFRKNPVLGVGFNSYRFALKEYQLAPFYFIEGRSGAGNDSSFIFILATIGIVGLTAYLYFIFSLFFNALKKIDQQKIIFISGLSGLIAHAFFNNSLFYPPLFLWVVMMASLTQEPPHKA